MFFVLLFIATTFAYLVGAVPFGAVIAGINKVDIHTQGSGKMGTTNVLRSVGRRAALLVLVGDVVKGILAVLAARIISMWVDVPGGRVQIGNISISATTLFTLIAALAAISGHVWSIYIRLLQGRWYGGRGVATSMGAVLVIHPLIILIAMLVAVPTILLSRYVSLGSIVGAATGGLALIVLVALGQMEGLAILYVFLPLFIIAAHRDNISRLLKGTERKLGERVKA
jgi:glycerol-3-phosphate acyltransferase PlsY